MKCQECRFFRDIPHMKRGECTYVLPYWAPDRGTIKGDQFVTCKAFMPAFVKPEVKQVG